VQLTFQLVHLLRLTGEKRVGEPTFNQKGEKLVLAKRLVW